MSHEIVTDISNLFFCNDKDTLQTQDWSQTTTSEAIDTLLSIVIYNDTYIGSYIDI